MTSISSIFTRPPSEFFLGVVELDHTIIVGVLDDPIGIELAAIRLAYPIELAQKWEGEEIVQAVIVPECGVPDELVVEAGTVAIYQGSSDFGATYFKNLRTLTNIRSRGYATAKVVSRAQLFKNGGPSGAR